MFRLCRLIRDERAATAIEYGLIVALVALAAVAALTGVGQGLSNTFNAAGGAM